MHTLLPRAGCSAVGNAATPGRRVQADVHGTNRHLPVCVQPHTAGLITDEKLGKVDALQPLAAELGCTLTQLAVAWAASNPDVSSVILGATRVCG